MQVKITHSILIMRGKDRDQIEIKYYQVLAEEDQCKMTIIVIQEMEQHKSILKVLSKRLEVLLSNQTVDKAMKM